MMGEDYQHIQHTVGRRPNAAAAAIPGRVEYPQRTEYPQRDREYPEREEYQAPDINVNPAPDFYGSDIPAVQSRRSYRQGA